MVADVKYRKFLRTKEIVIFKVKGLIIPRTRVDESNNLPKPQAPSSTQSEKEKNKREW